MKNNQNGLTTPSTGLTTTKHLLPKTPIKSSTSLKDKSNINTLTISQDYSRNEANEITILKKLFFFYSLNERHITFHQFSKLIKDSKIATSENEEKTINIIFNTSNKRLNNNTSITLFCEIIVQIAEMKYYSTFIEDQFIALNNLLSDHFIPLLIDLQKNNKILSSNWKFFLSKLSLKDTINLVIEHSVHLRNIYRNYFIDNYNIITDRELLAIKAEKALIQFCKDYAVLPKYSTLCKVKEIFNTISSIYTYSLMDIMNKYPEDNEGSIFTFYHFVAFLFFLSLKNNYRNINTQINNQLWTPSAMNQLINELISKTDINLIVKACIKKSNSNGQLPNYDSKLSTCYHTRKLSIDINNDTNSFANKNKECNKKTNKDDKSVVKSIDELIYNLLSCYSNVLLLVYKYYCELYHDGFYSILMSKKGIIHFTRNLQLTKVAIGEFAVMKGTNQSFPTNQNHNTSLYNEDNYLLFSSIIDSLFQKYSCHKNHINFNLFVRFIMLLASKLSQNSIPKGHNNAKTEQFLLNTFFSLNKNTNKITQEYPLKIYHSFIEKYLYPLYEQIKANFDNEAMKLRDIQATFNEDEFQMFFNEIGDIFLPILSSYSKSYNRQLHTTSNDLSFEELLHFLTHFNIFPDLISRNILMLLCISLFDNFDQTIIFNGLSMPKIQCEDCLIVLLFICCIGQKFESIGNAIDNNAKIAFLLQKILKSDGLKTYISNTMNNKVLNQLIRLYQKYDTYNIEKPNRRQSFFKIIKNNI